MSAKLIVRIVLIAILLVMIAALGYDRKVARPAVDDAFDKVKVMNTKNNQKGADQGGGITTNADVQKILGRKPSKKMKVEAYNVEVYSWRAGIPWRTYDYFAVYGPTPDKEGRLVLMRHYAHELPTNELIYTRPPRQDIELPPDETMGGGGGGGGGRGQGSGPGVGRGPGGGRGQGGGGKGRPSGRPQRPGSDDSDNDDNEKDASKTSKAGGNDDPFADLNDAKK